METVQLKLDDKGKGRFYIEDDEEITGEMEVGVHDGLLTVYHTEVSEKAQGRGYARLLLKEMVDYARENSLKVKPLCTFVHAQFKRHSAEYDDIWQKKEA